MSPHLTRSQERILKLLDASDRALSAQDLYLELRQRKQGMGLATVYRALDGLKLAGSIQVRTLASGESLYSSSHEDRHHLTCLHCGNSIELDQCPVHQLETQLRQQHQFKIYYHTLEFFGICTDCQAAGIQVPQG
ncbi:Fur family transcriptional regulator [Prochlorothrix hollandica]|uniref:Fur family transcriptional regulator n=1 Tax=Prochlorothrix hollandica PCC 9006 = CALU 1027 TaxID=317619 RepID=A0A0M2Q485_PROHO|nr:Fur family transcriptional regulator [Prochlorothrix hollandica]KKJ01382.1 Fur family transcriptional regulator [Prochlorothrix hollandica PCC 9006 = CALU 1027]